jgi:hypothetical protein
VFRSGCPVSRRSVFGPSTGSNTSWGRMRILMAPLIRPPNLLQVFMLLHDRFTTPWWMNLVIGTPPGLLTPGIHHRMTSSFRTVTAITLGRLTWMNFLGQEGVSESWRIDLRKSSLRTQVSILSPISLPGSWMQCVDSKSSTGPVARV